MKALWKLAGGFAGGVAATLPMTIAMIALKRSLVRQDIDLPPQKIAEHTMQALDKHTPLPVPVQAFEENDRQEFSVPSLFAHYGYGGGAGSLYGPLMGQSTQPVLVKGLLFGMLVWGGSYLGLVPGAKLYPSATRQSAGLNATMILSHLVWGSALAFLYDMLSGRRRQTA